MKKFLTITLSIILISVTILYFWIVFLLPKTVNSKAAQNLQKK